jgi:hypothetical protein
MITPVKDSKNYNVCRVGKRLMTHIDIDITKDINKMVLYNIQK